MVNQDVVKEHLEKAIEARRRLSRLAVGANAGGVVATLSFMGALLATGQDTSVPRDFFWALLIYLLGLLAATIEAYADLNQSMHLFEDAAEAAGDTSGGVRPWLVPRRTTNLVKSTCVSLAFAAFLAGSFLGLVKLYLLSS